MSPKGVNAPRTFEIILTSSLPLNRGSGNPSMTPSQLLSNMSIVIDGMFEAQFTLGPPGQPVLNFTAVVPDFGAFFTKKTNGTGIEQVIHMRNDSHVGNFHSVIDIVAQRLG